MPTLKINNSIVELLPIEKAVEQGYVCPGQVLRQRSEDRRIRPGKITYYAYINGTYRGVTDCKRISKFLKDKKHIEL
jgi:hypothetical protein